MEYNNGDQIRDKGKSGGTNTVYTVVGKAPRSGDTGGVRIVVAYQPKNGGWNNGGWNYTEYGKDFLDNFFEPVPQEFEAGKTYSIRVGAELGHTFRVFTVEDDIAYGILTYPDGSKTAVDRGQYRYPLIVESVVDDAS